MTLSRDVEFRVWYFSLALWPEFGFPQVRIGGVSGVQ